MTQPPDPTVPPPPPPGPGSEPAAGGGSYQRPADYYGAPPAPAEKKGCPRWLMFGCGGLGCLGLIIAVALVVWFTKGGGGTKVTGLIVTQLQKDAEQFYEADVPEDERARLEENLSTLKRYIDEGRVEFLALQPIVTEINAVIRDRRLTRDEVERLNERIEQFNEEIGSTPVSVRGGPPEPLPLAA